MHQSQRFMRRHHDDLNGNVDTFRSLLEKAPGVNGVSKIEAHQKGGYRAAFDLEPDCIDAFLSELESNGWMTVF